MTLNMKDVRSKTKAEVVELLNNTKKEIEKVAKEVMNGEEKDLGKPRKLRKDVARLQTIINEMEVKNA